MINDKRDIKMINTEQELIEVIKAGELIVLDHLIPEFYIYDYDYVTDEWYQKATIDIDETQCENLEQWNQLGIISKNIFISPETSMASSYSLWCLENDGNQDEAAAISAKKMGL